MKIGILKNISASIQMTILEWAIISTIHQEPEYVFSQGENSAARKMERLGWLKSRGHGKFRVAAKGEKIFKENS